MAEIYDSIGGNYTQQRRADPHLATGLRRALGDAMSVVNVGAGTGSYEPADLAVIAVEPSTTMITQRGDRRRTVRARAEDIPLRDGSVDAAMAVLTLHHWRDWRRGLGECARVARRRVVLFTWDPDAAGFWLTQDYFPDLLALDRAIFPTLDRLENVLGKISISPVPIPAECTDGFLGAYWRRPAVYADSRATAGMSSFARIKDVESRQARLLADVASGAWRHRYRGLLAKEALDVGYRIVTAPVG